MRNFDVIKENKPIKYELQLFFFNKDNLLSRYEKQFDSRGLCCPDDNDTDENVNKCLTYAIYQYDPILDGHFSFSFSFLNLNIVNCNDTIKIT